MRSVYFRVPGEPVAKERPRTFTDGTGKTRTITPRKTQVAEQMIGYEFRRQKRRSHAKNGKMVEAEVRGSRLRTSGLWRSAMPSENTTRYIQSCLPSLERTCRVCKNTLSLSAFGRDARAKDGISTECKACRVIAAQRWYRANTERKRAYNALWREQKADEIRAQKASYQERNRDKIKTKERLRSEVRRRLNPERAYAMVADWYRRNPDAVRAKSHRRRAREQNALGLFTAHEFMSMKSMYGHRCLACGRHDDESPLSADHVVPLARGGSNDIGNIQPLCKRCNNRKFLHIIDYRRSAFARILARSYGNDCDLHATPTGVFAE